MTKVKYIPHKNLYDHYYMQNGSNYAVFQSKIM